MIEGDFVHDNPEGKINYFDEELSTSLKIIEEEEIYSGVNFLLGTKVKDYFYFGDKKVEYNDIPSKTNIYGSKLSNFVNKIKFEIIPLK